MKDINFDTKLTPFLPVLMPGSLPCLTAVSLARSRSVWRDTPIQLPPVLPSVRPILLSAYSGLSRPASLSCIPDVRRRLDAAHPDELPDHLQGSRGNRPADILFHPKKCPKLCSCYGPFPYEPVGGEQRQQELVLVEKRVGPDKVIIPLVAPAYRKEEQAIQQITTSRHAAFAIG